MLPEEVSHEIWFGEVGDGAFPAEVIQLVLLHVVLQLSLIGKGLEAELTQEMVPPEVNHVIEEPG